MSDESTRAQDRTEGGHRAQEEEAPDRTWRNLVRSARALGVSFGPSVVLDLLLAASVAATASGALPDPSGGSIARLLRRAATLGSLASWGYVLALRPWHLRWGVTSEESRMPMPGDELVPRPVVESTRGVSVQAPISEVWPWLVQMGAGRGGLYSYDWLENLAGLGIHSADRISPELQNLKEGDTLPLDARGEGPTVAVFEPERALVLDVGPSVASWGFILQKIDERTTRLYARFRLDADPRPLWRLLYALAIDIPHFVMERKMLLGIKQRAERVEA